MPLPPVAPASAEGCSSPPCGYPVRFQGLAPSPTARERAPHVHRRTCAIRRFSLHRCRHRPQCVRSESLGERRCAARARAWPPPPWLLVLVAQPHRVIASSATWSLGLQGGYSAIPDRHREGVQIHFPATRRRASHDRANAHASSIVCGPAAWTGLFFTVEFEVTSPDLNTQHPYPVKKKKKESEMNTGRIGGAVGRMAAKTGPEN